MLNRILLIDDDDIVAVLLESIIGERYVFSHVADGHSGLLAARESRPDIILLDVELPDISGYDVCRQLKQDADCRDIPVVFLSARVDQESRLQGYDAGGLDYVTKPCLPDELLRKLLAVIQYVHSLRSNVTEAHQVTRVALEAAGDAGQVLGFLRKASMLNSYEALADACLHMLGLYQLQVLMQLRGRKETVSLSNHGRCSPLEESILSNMEQFDRIVDLGHRTVFNFAHVLIIIDNMPMQNQEQHSRIKDIVALMGDAIDIRMNSLASNQESYERENMLLGILHKNMDVTRDLVHGIESQGQGSTTVLSRLVKECEQLLENAGLDQARKDSLQGLMRGTLNAVQQLDQQVIDAKGMVETMQNEMDLISKALLRKPGSNALTAAPDVTGDVELF